MVTALAALEAGKVDLKEQLPCSGVFEYYGQSYRCWRRSGHDSCDLHRALRESCDCYFYELARRAGIEESTLRKAHKRRAIPQLAGASVEEGKKRRRQHERRT